ncbi:hypothetical protein ACHAWO_002587 [Cyclotella atomus]|uniref:Rubredoxin-like domain-containing protein n=1 Tax=Cyclotella atomus TaxID=382360 RepID=A0ABD3P4J1_9STRA
MKVIQRLSLAALCAAAAIDAFTISPTTSRASLHNMNIQMTKYDSIHSDPSIEVEVTSRQSKIQRIQQFGKMAWERMDTIKSAGFIEESSGELLVPMQAGFKTNIGLLVAAFLFKWYRARFVTKIPVWDRQPQWNMVVTSPEQEKELHAYQCKSCGSTIFIARHREWFFKGGNTECTNCGAKGKDNFVDIRDDVIEEIDDDYFDYPSPLDYVSAAEKRRLVKEAGGDEELAKKIAIEKALKEDPKQIQVEGSDGEGVESGDGGEEEVTKEKKSKKKKSEAPKEEEPKAETVVKAEAPKKAAPKMVAAVAESDDDILDLLDMD